MQLNIIFAQGTEGAFGLNNTIPWRSPTDLAYFKHMTKDHAVVMGRHTWYSLPEAHRPLKGRVNIVVSQEMANQRARPHLYMQDTEQRFPTKEDLIIARSLDGAIKEAEMLGCKKVFVIGGPSLIEQAFPRCDFIFQTIVDYDGSFDVKAPTLPNLNVIRHIDAIPSSYSFTKSDRDEYGVRFVTWKRKGSQAEL